jgi:heme oxygenase (biliverdin-IX-beta and delta-forming)
MLEQNPATGPSAVAELRAATRADHDAVDAGFGHFALGTVDGYRDFLTAHARILPLAERLIQPQALVDGWTGRTRALLADLAALGGAVPDELDFALPEGQAARWGALYVMEGSRLGGAVLAKSVPDQLPAAYLGARHAPGGWRALLVKLDEADAGPAWRKQAVAGARALFGAYLAAARRQGL